MRISDWSSDVCSSDLLKTNLQVQRPCAIGTALAELARIGQAHGRVLAHIGFSRKVHHRRVLGHRRTGHCERRPIALDKRHGARGVDIARGMAPARSEEHTSELQSLMRISYAVFCLKKKKKKNQ